MQALESQIASLESLVQKLTKSSASSGRDLLSDTAVTNEVQIAQSPKEQMRSPTESTPEDSIPGRAHVGRMRKFDSRKATQFYGSTSLFEIQTSKRCTLPRESIPRSPSTAASQANYNTLGIPQVNDHPELDDLIYSSQGEICRELMGLFFKDLYSYNMCIYREYFLRDYATGGGPYYSDMLMYAICASAVLVSQHTSRKALSVLYAKKATLLLYDSLELPELTTLQSLILLGHMEIGQGHGSKGWLFCGMACRLTHEMGLHLDPSNWNTIADSSTDREVLRRVYWAVFIVDKQLSLYFGRPPALYPHEANVRNTIRIPYPPEWESLLDTFVCKGTSATAFEDGICVVGAFVHQAELSKIFHSMIVDVFENRNRNLDSDAMLATARKIHVALAKWLSVLPHKLHWNQWTVDKVPPYVLHLHMVFHTGMIILHRPPRHLLDRDTMIDGEDVEICYQSLVAILRLIQSYGKHYRFELLPLDFVHTLSAAAGVLLMKRYLEKSAWTDKDISKPLAQILEVMEIIEKVWPCVLEIREGILETVNVVNEACQQQDYIADLNMMGVLESGPTWLSDNMWYADTDATSADLGFLVTDDFLNGYIT